MALTYNRTTWQNRIVQRPRTYTETINTDSSRTDTPAPGTVVQAGTPLDEEHLNNMEEGIVQCVSEINSILTQIGTILATLQTHTQDINANIRNIADVQRVNETQSGQIVAVTDAHNLLAADEEALEELTNTHLTNTNNPHSVTKAQVGLGNVPNVDTNNQTPTYSETATNVPLTSGEKLSVAFGKLARAVNQLYTHMGNTGNPHSVTKAQVGLGKVENLTIDEQKPTFIRYDNLVDIVSGESMSITLSKLSKAVNDLIFHVTNASNPHNVDKEQVGLSNVPNVTTNNQVPTFTEPNTDIKLQSGETMSVLMGKIARGVRRVYEHITTVNGNPHSVTKDQVGLGNVPNVTTNNQTPTYGAAGTNQTLTSGEKLSAAFSKLARAVSQLYTHMSNTSNPHNVTKDQIGLGDVPNVSTNNQAPEFVEAPANDTLISGETMSNLMGKIARAVRLGYEHIANMANPHNVTLIQACAALFPGGTTPKTIGTYTGNGDATITVNGQSVKGQIINLGRRPAWVYIFRQTQAGGAFFEYIDDTVGASNHYKLETPSVFQLMNLYPICSFSYYNGRYQNYYHGHCEASKYHDAPETLLSVNHGGAAVLDTGFVVQSGNLSDMGGAYTHFKPNENGVIYTYWAW